MDKSSEENEIVLPWSVACTLFQYQVVNKALNQGKALSDVMDMLDRGKAGEMVEELKVWMDELVTEAGDEPIIRYGRSGDPNGIEYSVREHPAGLSLLTKDLRSHNWNRSEPTQEGGLMVGPGSPLYGRRIMRDPKELLASFPPEMIDQMGDELAASYAGEAPEINGVMTPNGLYQPTSVDKLTDQEIHNLGLKYVIYPAGQVPENERENLQHWLDNHAIGKGKVSWNASNIPKDDMKKLRNGEMPIRAVPGIELKITVPTGAGMFSSQSREADKR
jgi:hypothetical protein